MTKPTQIALGLFIALVIGAVFISSRGEQDVLKLNTVPITRTTSTQIGIPSSLPMMSDHMPNFAGITHWWNTPDNKPLSPADLKGKVVLVDFWTYSCINCIRTYPFIRAMQERYADKGLVIVGVHTPEFAFEADPKNVEREIVKNNLKHPIALDPDYQTWNAYSNHYWPAEYLFDRDGRLRHTHFGEGEYGETEEAIRALLEEAPVNLGAEQGAIQTPDFSRIKTPETYFGLERGDAFVGRVGSDSVPGDFTLMTPSSNQWSIGGRWSFHKQFVQTEAADTTFRFNVQADMLHLVMESADGNDKHIEVYVDGIKTKDLTVNASTLYDIASFPDAGRHIVELRIKESNTRVYAATFS